MNKIEFIPVNAYPAFYFSPVALCLLDFVDEETGLVVSCMYPLTLVVC